MQRPQIDARPRQGVRRIGLGQGQIGGHRRETFQLRPKAGDPVQIDLRQTATGQGGAFDPRRQMRDRGKGDILIRRRQGRGHG